MRRLFVGLLVLSMPVALIGTLSASASASAVECSTNWGSLQKGSLDGYVEGSYESLRTGRQTCYDRLVLEATGPSNGGYRVEYVDQVYRPGSGFLVPLRGVGKLRIIAAATAFAPDFPGGSPELANVSGYTTFRQVAAAGWFEGETTIGLGVRARLPFRVFTLPRDGGGSRLIIDVAHVW
jgi:hypothetical protein